MISACCAIASGAGIATQTLIFGEFITVIIEFATQQSTPSEFRDDISKLAYGELSSLFRPERVY